MMDLFLTLMRFFAKYYPVLIIFALLPSVLLLYFSRYDALYRKPWRYAASVLSLVVAALIGFLAMPFWIVIVAGEFNSLMLLIAIGLCFIMARNIFAAINFFIGGKMIKWLKKVSGRE